MKSSQDTQIKSQISKYLSTILYEFTSLSSIDKVSTTTLPVLNCTLFLTKQICISPNQSLIFAKDNLPCDLNIINLPAIFISFFDHESIKSFISLILSSSFHNFLSSSVLLVLTNLLA
jgi:hypothetical protein